MTNAPRSDTDERRPLLPIAIVAGAGAAAAQLASSVWNESRGDLDANGWGDAPVLVACAVVTLAVAYGVVTPRIERARGALWLGVAALALAAVAFWNPAPVILGIAAIG